jgi:hypothetical protein
MVSEYQAKVETSPWAPETSGRSREFRSFDTKCYPPNSILRAFLRSRERLSIAAIFSIIAEILSGVAGCDLDFGAFCDFI